MQRRYLCYCRWMLHLQSPSRPILIVELVLLMLGLPLAMVYVLPVKLLLPIIWLMAWACHYCVRKMEHVPTALPVKPEALTKENFRPILRRFMINAALLTVMTLLFKPELFLNFVIANPMFWLVVMLAYPLISVVPQEIIYRVYFFSTLARGSFGRARIVNCRGPQDFSATRLVRSRFSRVSMRTVSCFGWRRGSKARSSVRPTS